MSLVRLLILAAFLGCSSTPLPPSGCHSSADCAAGSVCEISGRCVGGGCRQDSECAAGQLCDASGVCVDLGRPDAGLQSVDAGMSCAPGTVPCGGSCASSCDGCQNKCANGDTCQSGRCVSPCAAGSKLCGGTCRAVRTDSSNCGDCDHVCPPGSTCESASCVCATDQSVCPTGCVDSLTDPTNCGVCGRTCASEYCNQGNCADCPDGANRVQGQCVCAIPGGQFAACHGKCIDVWYDASNCGRCDKPCAGGKFCHQGLCYNCIPNGTACETGENCCSGNPCVPGDFCRK